MRNHLLQKRFLSRRAFVLGSVQLGVSSLLVGRLFHLQTVKSDTYKTLAENNRINLQLLVPQRGLILDRTGAALAQNKVNYQLMMDRSAIKNSEMLFAKLVPLLTQEHDLDALLKKQLKRTPHSQNILLIDSLQWNEVSAIEFNAPALPGLSVVTGTLRDYPMGNDTSHLVGYVGTPSPEEAKGNRLLKMPGVKIGKNGLERMAEETLRGSPGLQHMEVNALGQYLKEVDRQDSLKGTDLHCTINAELQHYCAKRLGNESGSIVILDIKTGDVLTLCSVPAFDPNRFSQGISHQYWGELMSDKKTPLVNKTITGQYPPGSTFKMIVGLKALEAGQIHHNTRFYCPGHYDVGSHRFHCWKPGGHGHMTYKEAIEQSCDTFFYNVARKLGIEKMSEISHEFGLGESFNLGLIGEKTGLIPTPDWKRASYNQPWQTGDTINASIGQGYVLATPMQLAVMAARLASGRKVMPRLIMSDTVPVFEGLSVSEASLLLAQEGMINVTSGERGTARASQIKVEGMEMAGKTGTSQVRRITIRGQDQSRIPWEQRHHALFVSFAPYQQPRYAAAIVIEHGGGGSSAAAPVARDVMQKTQEIMEKEGRLS